MVNLTLSVPKINRRCPIGRRSCTQKVINHMESIQSEFEASMMVIITTTPPQKKLQEQEEQQQKNGKVIIHLSLAAD